MSEDLVCDSCGAHLPLPDLEGHITCPSCGRAARVTPPPDDDDGGSRLTVKSPGGEVTIDLSGWTPGARGATEWDQPAEKIVMTSETAETAAKAAKTGCGIGAALVSLLVLAIIGGVIYAVTTGVSSVTKSISELTGSSSSDLYPSSGSVTVLPGEGSTDDLVLVVTDNSGDSERKVVRAKVGPDGSETLWKSEPLPGDAYTASVAIEGDHLYVAAGDEVRLLSLATGAETWRATLTDKVTTRCESCFAVVQKKLVVRTDDAYLTGFQASSNEPLWSRRLNSTSARAELVGGNLVLVDDASTPGAPAAVETLDPATGRAARSISPSCPAGGEIYSPVTMRAGAQLVAVPGTGDLVAVFGSSPGCVVRWESASGTVRWTLGITGNYSRSDSPPLISGRDLVLATSGSMVHVDLGTGRGAELEQVADAAAEPHSLNGRTLIGQTTSTRGTSKGGVAAWDLNTNKRLWSVPLPKGAQPASTGPWASSDALFDGSPRSVLVTGGSSAQVVTFFGEDRVVDTQSLDLATGELGRPTRRTYLSRYSTSGTPSLTVEDIAPDRLVISVDSLLEIVPLPDGEILRWPED